MPSPPAGEEGGPAGATQGGLPEGEVRQYTSLILLLLVNTLHYTSLHKPGRRRGQTLHYAPPAWWTSGGEVSG